ncbi:hypothetical protein ATK74_0792 [Propionicimonas paludicola]|uniref:DUF4386 domain-containing protein n=2 Tax=Propionicimonas paludicola TaxID=185243 RepID=A0A2A9CPI5_9ACTN|nr:hypothetical protein ATK74_0792 [Propionicimonas paludicola]
MSITEETLTRLAAAAAVAGGLLFIAVQINHPPVDLALVTTGEWVIRQSMKVAFTVLALIGITGMYLRQVTKSGILGLIGYLILAAGFLTMFALETVGLVVMPAIAGSAPGYVGDVLAVATNGTAVGDIGAMTQLNLIGGIGYLAGGLVFGIAMFRANVLARWASILLAVATPLSLAIPVLPWINQRLFAIPTGLALIALGYSLWRESRNPASVAAVAEVPLSDRVGQ